MSLSLQSSDYPSNVGRKSSVDARIRLLAFISCTLIPVVAVLALGTGLTLGGSASSAGLAISTESLRWMAIGAVGLVAAAASLLVALLARSTAQSVSGTFAHTASLVDRIAAGDFSLALPASDDMAQEGMHQSLRRLMSTLGDNVAAAEALAAGAYRKVAPPRGADNAIGVALGKVADYMDRLATSAHRIVRGDLSEAEANPAASDTLGQAHAAMVRHIVAVMHDVEGMKQSISATTEAMRTEVEELIAGTGDDTEQLRRAADRVAQMALQAHANACRATTLEERSQDTVAIVREGASAIQSSLDALKEVCRKTEMVQDLARNAGLVATNALSTPGDAEAAQQSMRTTENEVRELAARAASVRAELNRLTMAGVDAAGESHLILDRMGDGVHETRYLVRELTNTSRSQAAELLAIDESVSEAHATARRNAATARQLASRVESLTSHSRRLDALLRRFQKSARPAVARTIGPMLYRTPAGAVTPQPMLAVVAK
jgi:methyl-accepting chemotaxis protein